MATIKPMDDVLRALYNAETRDEVENAMRFGGDVNEIADTLGMSPFHVASAYGPPDVLQAMIAHGGDLEAPVPAGLTLAEDPAYPRADYHETPNDEDYNRMAGKRPLDLAIDHSEPDVTRELLNAGASVERGRRETPVIHQALDHFGPGAKETLNVLLEHGVDPKQPNPLEHKETPLHRSLPIDVMHVLVDHGADVNALDSRGRTPLVNAIHANNQDAATFLMEQGTDKAQALDHTSIKDRSWSKRSIDTLRMVHEADGERNRMVEYHINRIDGKVVEQHDPVAQAILDTPYVSDEPYVPSPAERKIASTLITGALSRRDLDSIANHVDSMGADILNETYDEHGQSLLGGAAFLARHREGESPLLRGLLDLGADPNARNEDGTPALMELDKIEDIHAVLAAGADPNAIDPRNGRTALHKACLRQGATDNERVHALLDYGARHDVKDHEGNTPLTYAGTFGMATSADALISRGADARVAMECPAWNEMEAKGKDRWDFEKDAMDLVRSNAVVQEKQSLRQVAGQATQEQEQEPAPRKPRQRL